MESQYYDRYQLWKCNVPLLYDVMTSHVLPYPALSISWLRGSEKRQRLLYGTNAPADRNVVCVGEVTLQGETNTSGPTSVSYDCALDAKLSVVERYPHTGSVNRARAMPQNEDIFATQSSAGCQFVYNRRATSTAPVLPLHGGHTQEGFGLSWCPRKEGCFASGSGDGVICVWDIEAEGGGGCTSHTQRNDRKSTGGVGAVAFHPVHPYLLAAGGEDGTLALLDLRNDGSGASPMSHRAHTGGCNGVDFSPHNEVLLATAGDTTGRLWDIRNMTAPVHIISEHTDEVMSVSWATFNEGVLATSGADHSVCMWDMSRVTQQQNSGLLFVHAGHVARASDVAMCPSYGFEWYAASVSDDHTLHVWQMAEYIYYGQEEEES